MALQHSPSIVTNGLVFAYDMGNLPKSFKGGPVTNLIPSPSYNAYPSIGNGWGTYNTNQYNGATYFSIGSISSVSSNIVTTSGNHPLRSYDVVTPQTSGGGVTAGTNYFVKKLSNTTFCLYPYNGSQDGSAGYINPVTLTFKVYDDIAYDNKVSINSSSFPTMWWGPPHLPNSGLVKEIRSRGFTNPHNGDITDCIRLHYIRTDDVKDGMAYSVDTPMTPGTPHTVSFYYRAVDDAGVGKSINYYVYNYSSSAAGYSQSFTLSREWKKFTFTYTPAYSNSISYWFPESGGVFSWEWSCMQTEIGSVANVFYPGTRSNTQAIIDQTNNSTITASSLTYASNNTFSFNGGGDTMNCGNPSILSSIAGTSAVSVEAWVNLSGYGSSSYGVITHKGYPWTWLMENPSNTMSIRFYLSSSGDVSCPDSTTHALNTWYHFVGTYDGSYMRFYRNGVLTNSVAGSGTLGGASSSHVIGSYSGAYYSQGQIPVVRIYNRTLSAFEINQNFNALRGRYGI
jgi:hypothetical protein